jgi:hypothetical protein
MRQLHSFLNAIHKRITTRQWVQMSFHAQLAGAEIKSLDDVLGVSSEETSSAFDPKTDAALERRALQMLEEQKRLRNV